MILPRQKLGYVNNEPVYCKSRTTHMSLFGKSGSGKSMMVLNHIAQDHLYGVSTILVEPSGFLARDAYSVCRGKALYCSKDNPISLNPLMSIYEPDVKGSMIAEILNEACSPDKDGPNKDITVKMHGELDRQIKHALQNNRPSLLAVRDYLRNAPGNSEAREGLIHRMNYVLSCDKTNKITCGQQNPIRWGELIDKGQSFFLDTFSMTPEQMRFCGHLVTQGIKNYFRMERREKYKPVALYVDEVQNFITPRFYDIMLEGRKYNISVSLSTQSFAMLSDTMRRLMLNVGTIVAFRSGARESEAIAKEIGCKRESIQFIDKYHCVFLTEDSRTDEILGFCKAPRPPIFSNYEPKKVIPEIKSKGWFSFESYQGAEIQ